MAHLAVVGAQEQRLDAVKDLLLTGGDSIQVQVDEVGNELEREALEFILIWSVEVEQLNADRTKQLKRKRQRS